MAKNKNKNRQIGVLEGVDMVESDVEDTSELIEFEEWYARRKAQIPPQHKVEILRADFAARKLAKKATMEEFDGALAKYGISLN